MTIAAIEKEVGVRMPQPRVVYAYPYEEMDVEELRETCRLLAAHLVYEQKKQEYLIRLVQEAAADGYRLGYGDAVAKVS